MNCPKCRQPMRAAYTGETLTSSPPMQVWQRECACGHKVRGYDRCNSDPATRRPIYRDTPLDEPTRVYSNEPFDPAVFAAGVARAIAIARK